MQRKLIAAALVAALALSAPAALALDLGGNGGGAPERIIVGFYGEPPAGATYQGERVVAADRDLSYLVVETSNGPAFRARAALDADVRYVELDDPRAGFVTFTPNDYYWNHAANWGVKKIDAPLAWDRTLGSTAVKVAVTDSGVLKTHEDLTGARMLQGYDYYNNDNDPDDKCGHGTHVTGTIAATINNGKGFPGMAQVNVAMFKGLESSFGGCYGSTTALANALKAAGDGGYPLSSNSWGSSASSATFNDAIAYSFARGVTFVAAAGNEGPCTDCVGYPWRDNPDKVIIVSATRSDDTFATTWTGSTTGSSQGPAVDVSAPGDEIGSAYIQPKGSKCGNACYVKLSGTSMAAPHVTGTLALVKTLNPTFGYAELDARIKGSATDLGPSGFDVQYGFGRLNAGAAVY